MDSPIHHGGVAANRTSKTTRSVQLQRHLLLVRHLLKGKPLDRNEVVRLLSCIPEEGDRFLRDLKASWPELEETTSPRSLRLVRARGGVVHDSVAIAAAFGASLAGLFAESTYGPALRDACREVVALVRKPEGFADLDRKFFFVKRGGEVMLPASAGVLDDVIEAVLRNRYVTLSYRRFDGSPERITVRALSVVVADHQLYVIGRDDRGSDHPYRFSRIEEAEVELKTYEYPAPTEYDPDTLFAKSFGVTIGNEFPEREIEIHLTAKWTTFARTHRWHRSQRVDVRKETIVVKLTARICPELVSWVLGFGEEAEVIAPKELREEVARRLQRAAARYSND